MTNHSLRLWCLLWLNDWFFALVFVDDIHMAAGGSNRWLTLWRFIAMMEMVGVPFSYHKFRGGFQLDYVGFWMDYSRFETGLSEKRAKWLLDFAQDLSNNQWIVNIKRFQEFHGRLGFASQILPWIRPFFAPGYSWIAAVNKASTLKVPELVAASCVFIQEKFSGGLRKLLCGVKEKHLCEIFRTDAKCVPGLIVLGGMVAGTAR